MNTLSHFTTSDNHLIPPQGYPPTHYEYLTYQELPPSLLRNIYYPPHQLPQFNFTMESMQHSDGAAEDFEADQKVRHRSWFTQRSRDVVVDGVDLDPRDFW